MPPYQPRPLRVKSLHQGGGKPCVLPHSSYFNPNFLTDCRWRLPLWLLLFGVVVSVLTLSYLLTGTVYPNSWTRFSPESLGMLTASEGFYRAGHRPSTIDDAASNKLKPVSHSTLNRVFAQISKSGDITMVQSRIGRPSFCGGATLVDNTVRFCRVAMAHSPAKHSRSWFVLVQVSLLVQVRMPHDTPRGARCAVTSGITLARRLEAAGKVARVQVWSLAQTTPDANTWATNWDARPQREAHVSSFEVRPGGRLLHSAEFGCPPPSQSLQTFEVSCAPGGDDDACSVDVWQDLFRVEIRA